MSAISGIVNLQGAGLDKWILDDFADKTGLSIRPLSLQVATP